MNKLIYILLSAYLIVNFFQCKSDKPVSSESESKLSTTSGKVEPNADPMLIQLPAEVYRPEGMRPLNVMEMFDFGTANPALVRNLPLKDKNGNPVPYKIMENLEKPVFMQMYANDSNRVVEGVVVELTDDIKSIIMKVRMVKSGN